MLTLMVSDHAPLSWCLGGVYSYALLGGLQEKKKTHLACSDFFVRRNCLSQREICLDFVSDVLGKATTVFLLFYL